LPIETAAELSAASICSIAAAADPAGRPGHGALGHQRIEGFQQVRSTARISMS
jgi:hypothetical protein